MRGGTTGGAGRCQATGEGFTFMSLQGKNIIILLLIKFPEVNAHELTR